MSTPTGHVSAAEYGRSINVGKSGISRLIARGMPYVDGTDGHNRLCKFIDPEQADAWRAVNLQPKINGNTGEMRGVVDPRLSTPPPEQPPPLDGVEKPPSDAFLSDGGEPDTQQRQSPKPSPPHKPGGEGDVKDRAASIALRTQEMRMQREEDITATARLRRLAAERKLIDREQVLEGHATFVGQVGKLIDRIPADNASTLAAALGVDQHQTYLALQKMADGLRSDLASTSARERDRAGEREVELPTPDFDG